MSTSKDTETIGVTRGAHPSAPPTSTAHTVEQLSIEAQQDFIALAIPYLPRLRAYIRECARPNWDVDNLEQETVFKILRSWHKYKADRDLFRWMRAIARNSLIDCARAEKNRFATQGASTLSYDAPEILDEDETYINLSESLDCIRKITPLLTEANREFVEIYYNQRVYMEPDPLDPKHYPTINNRWTVYRRRQRAHEQMRDIFRAMNDQAAAV